MLRQRKMMKVLVSRRVWLAMAFLAIAPILYFANLASAQESSTTSTPSAPTLTALPVSGGIDLNWEAVQSAERYELWAWTSADGFQQLDDGAWTDTSYNHTGLTAGKTYFYTVRAVLTGGVNGPWSEYVSAIFEPSLSAPVLTAEAGEEKVELSWGAVQGAERYEFWVWTSADGLQRLDDGARTGTTYRHAGLTAGTTYFYTIRAVNAQNESSRWAEYVNATPQQGPQHTATPTATSTSSAQQPQVLQHTATATATPTGDQPIRDVPPTATATATPTISATATPTATPTDDQLSQNFPATGAPSISGTAKVCETLTADVSNIADENGLENVSFSVTWSAGGGYLRKQTVDRFTYIVQTMDLGMTLNVSLHFEDDDGYSEFAESANTAVVVAAAAPRVPNAPGRVRVQTPGSGKLLVSWEGPFSVWCRDGGSPVTGFKVQWKEAADDWGTPGDVSEATGTYDGSPASYTINGLTDGVEYSVRVLARNAVGYGAASSTVTATPQDSATQ